MTFAARALLVLALLAGAPSPALAETGAVDLQRVLDGIAEGRAAKAELRSLLQKHQSTIDALVAAAKKLRAELDAEKSEDRAIALAAQLRDAEARAKQTFDAMQKEIGEREAQTLAAIIARVDEVLEELRVERGYDAIVRTAKGKAAPEGAASVTDEVIRRYDARFAP